MRVWVLRLNEHSDSIVDACVDDELIDSLLGARAVRALLTNVAFAGFMTFVAFCLEDRWLILLYCNCV